MRCSCPSILLPLLLPLLIAAAPNCPVLGPGTDKSPQTKAYLAPLVFKGTLTAKVKRGPALRATFAVANRTLKGPQPEDSAVVDFAVRQNPARCRGATMDEGGLKPGQQYIVFAALRRGKLIGVAVPEDFSRRTEKAVSRVLCDNCAKTPSIRGLKDTSLKIHSKLKLKCRISGNPPPQVTWFKNGHRVKTNSRLKIRSKRRCSHLVINQVRSDDSGRYQCTATNVLGNATANARIVVRISRGSTTEIYHRSLPTQEITSTTLQESTTESPTPTWHIEKVNCTEQNFCLNGATCWYYKQIKEYVCECANGFRGQRCESKSPISTVSSPSPADPPKTPHDMNATTHLLQHFWGR